MAALPYMQFYVSDYLADTAHLSAIQHGGYLLLLFNYWQRGRPISNANDRLSNVARMSSAEWAENKAEIAEFFVIDGDEWRHLRIDRDLAAVAEKSGKAAASGKASAQARAWKSANAEQTLNERSTNAEQTLNHKDTDTDKEETKACAKAQDAGQKPPALLDRFAGFWAAYPKKRNRGDAEKAWLALKPSAELAQTIVEAVEVSKKLRDDWRKDGGKFVPYPASWIRAKGWEDEVTPAAPAAVIAYVKPDWMRGAI
jgi:uncharacterized protein YdaU (DUF1376 family)